MSYVEAATRSMAPVIDKGAAIILESTSPVGKRERVADLIREAGPDLRIPRFKDNISDYDV